jgi:esterase/lipase
MKTPQEKFQELQEKSKKITEGAIQINTKIESARESYEKLAQVAQEKYGTSDIEELKDMLEKWQEENDSQVTKYQEAVESLEREVNEKSSLIKQIQQSAS